MIAVLFAGSSTAPAGAQAGLFYPDGTPKSSLAAGRAGRRRGAERHARLRGARRPRPRPTPTPTHRPTHRPPHDHHDTRTTPAPTTRPRRPARPRPQPAPSKPAPGTAPRRRSRPRSTRRSSSPSRRGSRAAAAPAVHLGCTAACLYLVTLQRAGDGAPVLARRGELPRAGARTVTLPKAPARRQLPLRRLDRRPANPGPVSVARSGVVAARYATRSAASKTTSVSPRSR